MRLRELAKMIVAKLNPEMTVKYGALTVSGPSEDRGFLRALEKGEREPFMVDTMLRQINSDSVFLDVGGHLGQYSLVVAQKMSSLKSGQVFSFEPHPRSFKYLAKNISQNDLSKIVTLENKCVSSKPGMVTLFSDNLQSDYSSMVAGADGSTQRTAVQVEAVSIDEYFSNREIPTLIKIDVEGAELIVLNGMRQLIEKHTPKMFIESNSDALKRAGSSTDELYSWLKSRYKSISVIEEDGKKIHAINDPSVIRDQCVNLFCQ